MDASLTFLSKVFDLLNEGEAFETQSEELSSIIDFKHPQELKVRELKTNVRKNCKYLECDTINMAQ